MHPPLFRPHPICSELVDKLVQCHKDYEIGKFFGACNDIKSEMDKCFRMEKEEKRQANLVRPLPLLLFISFLLFLPHRALYYYLCTPTLSLH